MTSTLRASAGRTEHALLLSPDSDRAVLRCRAIATREQERAATRLARYRNARQGAARAGREGCAWHSQRGGRPLASRPSRRLRCATDVSDLAEHHAADGGRWRRQTRRARYCGLSAIRRSGGFRGKGTFREKVSPSGCLRCLTSPMVRHALERPRRPSSSSTLISRIACSESPVCGPPGDGQIRSGGRHCLAEEPLVA